MINLVDRRAKKTLKAVKEGTAASKADADLIRQLVLFVLAVALLQDTFPRMGVKGGGTILQGLDDVLQFVLPCRILLAAAQDQDFFRAVRTAIIASLLHKVFTVRQYSAWGGPWGLPAVAGATCATAVTLVVLALVSSQAAPVGSANTVHDPAAHMLVRRSMLCRIPGSSRRSSCC